MSCDLESQHGYFQPKNSDLAAHISFTFYNGGIAPKLDFYLQDPFVAIVIDPVRTISAGKVNLGAFRTYPKGYKPPDEGPGEYQTIPLNKIEDFGVHCKSYYRLVEKCRVN